jgi:prevent-host-death family protein
MQTINIYEAKAHFSRLVERAAAGEEIIVAKAGKPVAKLVPYQQETLEERRARRAAFFGCLKGQVWVSDDFDDPLPDSFWLGEDVNNP